MAFNIDMGLLLWPLLLIFLVSFLVFYFPSFIYDQIMQNRLRRTGLNKIDTMPGAMFEQRLRVLFKDLGYKVELTKASNDYGADLILSKDGIRTVVQAKRYRKKVGIKAIQEAVAAKGPYKCDKAMVVTNSFYTKQAWNLAKANDVVLWNRKELIHALLKVSEKISGTTTTVMEIAATTERYVCDMCGVEITPGIVQYCQRNKHRFGGYNYCMDCQRILGKEGT